MKNLMSKFLYTLIFSVFSTITMDSMASDDPDSEDATGLNLAYVFDEKYVVPTITSITSVIDNADGIGCLNIYLVNTGNDVNTEKFKEVLNSVNNFGPDTCNLILIKYSDVSDKIGQDFSRIDSYTWSNAIYAKLFLHEILNDGTQYTAFSKTGDAEPEVLNSQIDGNTIPSACILLDGDTIVRDVNSLAYLYGLYVQHPEISIGMVEDFAFLTQRSSKDFAPLIQEEPNGDQTGIVDGKTILEMNDQYKYLSRSNAGLVYMYLDQMRNTGATKKLKNSLLYGQMDVKRNAGFRKFGETWTEEPTLSNVFRDSMIRLPNRFNYLNCFVPADFTGDNAKELIPADAMVSLVSRNNINELANAVMFHYSDARKVWTVTRDEWISFNCSPYMWDQWYEYFRQTPYCVNVA